MKTAKAVCVICERLRRCKLLTRRQGLKVTRVVACKECEESLRLSTHTGPKQLEKTNTK